MTEMEDGVLDLLAPVGFNVPVGTCQQRGYQGEGQVGEAGESPSRTVRGTDENDLVRGKRDAFRQGPCRPSGQADKGPP